MEFEQHFVNGSKFDILNQRAMACKPMSSPSTGHRYMSWSDKMCTCRYNPYQVVNSCYLMNEWMNGVLGHEVKLVMNHAPGAGSIARPVGPQSSALYHCTMDASCYLMKYSLTDQCANLKCWYVDTILIFEYAIIVALKQDKWMHNDIVWKIDDKKLKPEVNPGMHWQRWISFISLPSHLGADLDSSSCY